MNENIVRYIKDNYIKSEMKPQFAVLVKGGWGCGKTFLVKKILKESYKENYKENVVWISVYGLSSIHELRQKLLDNLFLSTIETNIDQNSSDVSYKPKFDKLKPWIRSINSLVNSFFKSKGIDVNAFNELFYHYLIKDKINGKILIVDDIERCSITIPELFGFFSEYIIEEDLKTIFISNDKEIKDLKYKAIKEKIIGMEFEVQPDIHEAVKFFVKEIGLAGYEKTLLEKALSVLNNLKYSNLRSIRQSFVHIRYIFDILKDSLKKDSITENYISRLVEYFLVLFVQKSSGHIGTESEFTQAIGAYSKSQKSFKDLSDNEKKDSYLGLYCSYVNVPLKSVYFNIIQKGDFSQKPILDDYQKFTDPHKPLTNLQYLTSQWYYLSDEDFKKYYNLLQQNFNNNEIISQEEIINWAELKFIFSNYKLISESSDDIKKIFLSYIDSNGDKLEPRNPDLSLGNPSFKDVSPGLNEIKESLKRANKSLWKKKIEKQFVDLYSGVSENITELEKFISDKFIDVPILSLTDVNKFYQKIKELDFSSQMSVYIALRTRYEKTKQKGLPDIDKIKEISELYEKDTGNIVMSPENLRKKEISKNYNSLYESMEKLKEGSDKTT